jgi:hypothetical protein
VKATRDVHKDKWTTLSDFYLQQYICTMRPAIDQKLTTKYLNPAHYSKKDTFSLFSSSLLLHETLSILDASTYKNQGAVLSDSEDDSSDEEDG